MRYGLTHNDRIQVGPRDWNYWFFRDYIDRKGLDPQALPTVAPSAAVITDTWRLLPVTNVETPDINTTFERLVGPTWTILADSITGAYTSEDRPLDEIRGELKNRAAANRYDVETGELTFTFPDSEQVTLFTDRQERNVYLQTLQVFPTGETVPFKFRNGVIRPSVTQSELADIVAAVVGHVRAAFEWERDKAIEIDDAVDIPALQAIEIRHPSQIPPEE